MVFELSLLTDFLFLHTKETVTLCAYNLDVLRHERVKKDLFTQAN